LVLFIYSFPLPPFDSPLGRGFYDRNDSYKSQVKAILAIDWKRFGLYPLVKKKNPSLGRAIRKLKINSKKN
tara:strand:- start:1940 stop:2152 length:213 start_codon:yes stop_codon:yes gene_type:complete